MKILKWDLAFIKMMEGWFNEAKTMIEERWFVAGQYKEFFSPINGAMFMWNQKSSKSSNWKYMVNDELSVKDSSWKKIFDLPEDLKKSIKDARKLAWVMSDWASHEILLEESDWLFFISFNKSRGFNLVWLINEEWIVLTKYDWETFKEKPHLLKDWTLIFFEDIIYPSFSQKIYYTDVCRYTSDFKLIWKGIFQINNNKLYYDQNIKEKILNANDWELTVNYLLTGSKLINESRDEVVIDWKKFKKKLMWI